MRRRIRLAPDARIVLDADPREAGVVAEQLAGWLRRASGLGCPSCAARPSPATSRSWWPQTKGPRTTPPRGTGSESRARASASEPHGRGALERHADVRQLLQAAVESGQPLADPLEVVAVEITDYPRFAYRSAMLDVARHSFTVEEVERFIDEIAMLKINTLHLHLANDQGWRIEIEGWPLLTDVGGLYEVERARVAFTPSRSSPAS